MSENNTRCNNLLKKCNILISDWDKEEDRQLQNSEGNLYNLGMGTGYGICAEGLRNAIKGLERMESKTQIEE